MNLDPKNQEKLLGFNNLFNHFVKLLDNKYIQTKITKKKPDKILSNNVEQNETNNATLLNI